MTQDQNNPYTIFISYSHSDLELISPELERLDRLALSYWFDDGIALGSAWREEVAQAISRCNIFLFFISNSSVVSNHCLKELNFADSRDKKIFPIFLEETNLPLGVELTIGNTQVVKKFELSPEAYEAKITDALSSAQITLSLARADPRIPLATDQQSLLILPFRNQSSESDTDYLAEGLVNELINGLSIVPGLRIISGMNLAFDEDVKSLGEQLKTQHCVGGAIQRVGNHVRISVNLLDTADTTVLWSHSYDRTIDDIFELQDEIAGSIIEALTIELDPSNGKFVGIGTRNPHAYDEYLKGMQQLRLDTHSGFEAALVNFEDATKLDPRFGDAYFQSGMCYWYMSIFGLPQVEVSRKASNKFNTAMNLAYQPEIPWVELNRRIRLEERPGQSRLVSEACNAIQEHDNSWQHFYFVQLGRCLGSADFFRASLDYHNEYLRLNPGFDARLEVENDFQKLLSAIGNYDHALSFLEEKSITQPGNQKALIEKIMLKIRLGRQSEAAHEIELIRNSSVKDFIRLYNHFWDGRDLQASSVYADIQNADDLQSRYKFWGAFLVDNFDSGFGHVQESITRGAPWFDIKLLLKSALPNSLYLKIASDSRYIEIDNKFEIDDDWRAELTEMCNKVSSLTRIRVRPDADY